MDCLNFGRMTTSKRKNDKKRDEAKRVQPIKQNQYADAQQRLSKMRAVVSMTSYPKRIGNVAKAIRALIEKQTRKPDEIHLWLCQTEFPEKLQSLPTELRQLESQKKVVVHWLAENTYVHKRHEIFNICGPNDLVFLMDDDVYYRSALIDTAMKTAASHPGTIILYNIYSLHLYKGRRILYKRPSVLNPPDGLVNSVRWCGQSAIPASVYPKDALAPSNKKIRSVTSPISDECWLQPWLVYKDTPIYCLNMGWGVDIDKNTGKDTGLVAWTHNKDENGYEKRDNWLYATVSAYPKFWKKYIQLFNYEKPVNK